MKKIAVNTVKAFLKEHKREDAYTQTFTMGDSSFEVAFHTALTVSEKTTFINRILRANSGLSMFPLCCGPQLCRCVRTFRP